MADKNIKIGVQVSDNGSSGKTSKNVNNLKDVLDQTTASANNATKAISAMNTAQAGGGRVSGGGRATTARIKQATGGGDGEDERGMYAAQRGTLGTGAAGRDFAKQSQGLDGLVRLYATFAANIYAAGAAFNALSQAMDTTNMVKGLNQLGAATGQNLGGLSKRFEQLTDSAISFKDAMSATVKVTSAGFGSDTVERLAVVAKKASQSLGVDMVDAVSRLSRGITKIEPELLDELGLFTKIDKAQEDYARSLGRTVTSLSDFEKRQAFANAVLTEGEKKFNSIEVDANPYAKLLATLKNVAQTGLEFINKFLGPIVKLLAESPTGVALAIAGIAAVLTKQALPALSNFREGLIQANEQALAKVKQLQETIEAKKAITMQQAANVAVDKEVKKLATGAKTFATQAANLTKKAEELTLAGDIEGASKANAQAQRKLELAEQYKTKIIETRKQVELLDAQQTAANSKNIFAQENILQRQKTSMEQNARLSKSLLNVADDAATLGAGFGFRRLGLELKNASKESDITGAALGRLQVASLAVRGTFTILTSAVSGLLAAFGPWLALIAMALPLLSMLYDWLRGDAKQAEETAKSFDTLQGSIENTSRTIERINKLDFGEQLTVETIIARSNALNDLSTSFTKVLESITKQKAAQGWFAESIDKITGGVQKDAAEKLSKSIILALEATQEGPAKEKAKEVFKNIFSLKEGDILTEKTIKSAIAKTKDFNNVTTEAGRAVSELAKEDDRRSKSLAGAKEAQDKTTKSYDDFIQSVLKTSAVTTLANNMISFGIELNKAFKDPISTIAELNRIANDSKALAMFSPEAQKDILNYNSQLQDIQRQLDSALSAQRRYAEESEKIKEKQQGNDYIGTASSKALISGIPAIDLFAKGVGGLISKTGIAPKSEDTKKLEDIQKLAKAQEGIIANLRANLTEVANQAAKVVKAPAEVFDKGMNLFITELNKSYGKAGLMLAEAVANAYGDIPGASLLSAELKNKELANQINLIDATLDLTKATIESALRVQESNALKKYELSKTTPTSGPDIDTGEALKELKEVQNTLKAVASTTGSYAELRKLQAEMKAAGDDQVKISLVQQKIDMSKKMAEGAGQKSVIKGQMDVNVFQAELKYETDKAAAKTRSNDLIKQENSFAIQRLNLQKDSLGLLREEDILKVASLTKQNLSLTYNNKNITIAAEQANLNKTIEESEKRLAEFNKTTIGAKSREAVLQQRTIEGAREKLALLERDKKLVEEIFQFESYQADLKARQEIMQRTEKIRLDGVSTQNTLLGFVKQEQEARLVLREQELSLLSARGTASETYLANVNAEIAAKRQELQVAQEIKAVEDAKAAAIANLLMLRAAIPVTLKGPGEIPQQDPELLAESQAKEKQILDTFDKQKASILELNSLKTKGNEIAKLAQLETAANNKRLEEQAAAMEKIQGAAQALGTVFGEFGKSLGTGLESILKASQDFTNKRTDLDKKYAKDRLDLEKSQTEEISIIQSMGELGANTEEDELKAKKKFGQDSIKLEKNNAKKSEELELDKNIAIASSAKSMFKEKTFAHKAFATFEKLMMVAKLAMLAQEAVATVANAATVVPAEGAKAAASGLSAIMKALNLPPPFGFIAGAAMAAIVASFLGNAVSGNVSIPAGSTAEERQEVQSTGQKYVDGKLVETGLGVLGDPTAELETIANGIDRLEKHSIGSLDLSNGMLDALKAIRENTGSFVTALVRTSITKQDPGSSGGNWLFGKSSTENIDKLLSISGTLQEVIEQTADVNQIIVNKVSESGFLGFGGDTSVERLKQKFEPEQQGEIEKSISLLFTSFADTVEAGTTALNLQLQPSWKALYKLPDDFETSLLNMSYEDVGKALEAGLGQVLGDFVKNTYPQLTRFQTAGEDLGSMFIRLGSDSQSLKAAFATVGTNLQTFTETTTNISTAAQRANTDSLRIEKERIEGLIAAQTLVRDAASGDEYIAAGNTIYYLGLQLATATTAYNNSLRLYNSGLNVSTTLNIEAEQRIIKANGGMDSFIERIKDFSKEILTAGDRTEIAGKSYGDFITGLVTTARTADTAARTALGNIPAQPDTVGPGGTVTTLGGYTMTRDVFGDIAAWQANGGLTRTAAEGNVAQTSEALTFAERLSSVKTRQEFKELYRSIDQSTDSGAKFAAVMLKIAPQFAEITDALEKYNTALEDQKIKMGALGIAGGLTPDQAKTVQRDRERTKIREEYTPTQAAELITNQEAIWLKEDEIATTKRSITLLQAQGKAHDALIKSRQLELLGMDALTAANQIEINSITDANKTRDLEMELAVAQGNAQVALNHSRSKELAALSETDRAIKQATFDRQDANKTRDLEMDLARLQGNAQVALNHSRSKELDLLSAGDRAIKETIFAEQDRLDLRSREISLMNAQGYTYAAMLEQRKLDLKLLTTEQQTRQLAIYAQEDINKTESLNIQLMEASGDTLGALYANRVKELKAMSESDQAIQIRIWTLQDEAKINDLNIELMEASGDAAGALYARRTLELKGMSASAQELKRRIWLLEDEKKLLASKNAQEIKIYELLGNAVEVTRLQREAELEAMDAALRPGQRYIYALEDQKAIYDKLKTTINNTTSSLKSSIQTLKDYQASLKTGDKSILKPAEIYAIRKQEFFNLKAIAEAVATTPAELAAQETAISKLPQAADSFLESSKTLFASGQAYTDDFNLVDSILSSLTTALTGQLSDAEKSLAELKDANGFLETIDESTKNTSELMAELLTATNNLAAAQAAAAAAGYASAGGSTSNFNTGTSVPDIQTVSSTIPGIQTAPILPELTPLSVPAVAPATAPTTATAAMEAAIATAPAATAGTEPPFIAAAEITRSWYENHPLTTKDPRAQEVGALWWAQFLAPPYSQDLSTLKETFSRRVSEELNLGSDSVVDIGRFARGGLANGFAMVGEEGPELVDFQTPGRVYPAGQTTAMLANNTALVNEIKALRQEVEKLRSEQKEQTGHLITTNYDATRIAAEMLAKATEESSKEAAWANRSAARVV